jgi:AFG3 family protein
LATALLEKETLDLTKLVDILGQRPFAPKSNYKAFLELKKMEQTEAQEEKKAEAAEALSQSQ